MPYIHYQDLETMVGLLPADGIQELYDLLDTADWTMLAKKYLHDWDESYVLAALNLMYGGLVDSLAEEAAFGEAGA